MKIYLAAKFQRNPEMREIAARLRAQGHEVTSQWIHGAEATKGSARDAAEMDLSDIDAADVLVFFGHPRGSENRGGGRWFEFGWAYRDGKRCYAVLDVTSDTPHDINDVGHESVFTHLEGVRCFFSQEEFLEHFAGLAVPAEVVLWSDALGDIRLERERQQTTASGGEGWTEGHDDEHTDGSLAQAAAAYALYSAIDSSGGDRNSLGYRDVILEEVWPDSWDPKWLRPKDSRSDLVRAGALIVAEIERLDRAAAREKK